MNFAMTQSLCVIHHQQPQPKNVSNVLAVAEASLLDDEMESKYNRNPNQW